MLGKTLIPLSVLVSICIHASALGTFLLIGSSEKPLEVGALRFIQATYETIPPVQQPLSSDPGIPKALESKLLIIATPERRLHKVTRPVMPKDKKSEATPAQEIKVKNSSPSTISSETIEKPQINDDSSGQGSPQEVIFESARLGITPTYPKFARQHGQEGRVLCKLVLLKMGAISSVEIIKSSGFLLLDEAAVSAIKNAQLPANAALKSESLVIAVNFKLKNR